MLTCQGLRDHAVEDIFQLDPFNNLCSEIIFIVEEMKTVSLSVQEQLVVYVTIHRMSLFYAVENSADNTY